MPGGFDPVNLTDESLQVSPINNILLGPKLMSWRLLMRQYFRIKKLSVLHIINILNLQDISKSKELYLSPLAYRMQLEHFTIKSICA